MTQRKLRALRKTEPGEAGNRIRKARRLAGLTQSQLAEAIGESQAYISDIESGRWSDTYLSKAQKVAAFFGCRIEDLWPESVAKAS